MIQRVFLKPSLVKFLSKDTSHIFYQFPHRFTLQTGDFNIIINFQVNSTSSTSFKKCNVLACSIIQKVQCHGM